jgi:hypothetical protein
MKMHGAALQGGLAALGLIAAYTTWQRAPEHRAGEVTLVDATQNDLRKIRYQDDGAKPPKWVELERRQESDGAHVWMRTSPRVIDPKHQDVLSPEREVRGNEAANKLFDKFAPLRATRALGVLAADKLKEVGLDVSKKRLEVTASGSTHAYTIGASPFGVSDPYVKDEADGKVYVLGGGVTSDLDSAAIRLVDRDLHSWKPTEFDGLTITFGDKKRELFRAPTESPTQFKLASKSGRTDDLAKNWHDKVWRMLVTDVLGKGETPKNGEPVVVMRIDYTQHGRSRGFLEVARVAAKPPEPTASTSSPPPPPQPGEVYARTEHTAGWVKIGGNVEDLLREAPGVAGSAD